MLSDYIRRVADWRDAKAEAFPDDVRNVESATALRALADFYESFEEDYDHPHFDDFVCELEPHIPDDPSGRIGGTRANKELTRFGFGYGVVSEAAQVAFLRDLWVACMEDAYEHAVLHDEDPTEQLSRVERGAAKFGLKLPQNYWRRRRETNEDRLEAEIDQLMQIRSLSTAAAA